MQSSANAIGNVVTLRAGAIEQFTADFGKTRQLCAQQVGDAFGKPGAGVNFRLDAMQEQLLIFANWPLL